MKNQLYLIFFYGSQDPKDPTQNRGQLTHSDTTIVNGAQGFVQLIQTSKENPEKVDVLWVVFNKDSIGRLYWVDHRYLRQHYNPGHEAATQKTSKKILET